LRVSSQEFRPFAVLFKHTVHGSDGHCTEVEVRARSHSPVLLYPRDSLDALTIFVHSAGPGGS
jgi:hypothetical protein